MLEALGDVVGVQPGFVLQQLSQTHLSPRSRASADNAGQRGIRALDRLIRRQQIPIDTNGLERAGVSPTTTPVDTGSTGSPSFMPKPIPTSLRAVLRADLSRAGPAG
jgi:hypothetical protein